MPSEFEMLIDDLEDWRHDRARLKKALTWIDEIEQQETIERLQATDREIDAERCYRQEARLDLSKAMMDDLSPQARRARLAEYRQTSRRLTEIASTLQRSPEEVAADQVNREEMIAMTKRMNFDPAEARARLAKAVTDEGISAIDAAKGERLINQIEGGMLAKAMPSGADRQSEAHCRQLLNNLVADRALSAVDAARLEAEIHHRFG